MLLGAVVGAKVKNIPLAILLALLCHYFLDLFPHVEYSITKIKDKTWNKALPDFLKVLLDFLLGIFIISLFSKNQLMIYLCALVAIIPDGFTLLSSVFPNRILKFHDAIHTGKIIHYFKYKKISNVWRIATQVITVIVCIILLR